jgi:hypothetical protein
VLEPGSPADTALTNDPIQAIVVADGQRSLGIMVDQILDIVDEAVAVRSPRTGSACWDRRWWARRSRISSI